MLSSSQPPVPYFYARAVRPYNLNFDFKAVWIARVLHELLHCHKVRDAQLRDWHEQVPFAANIVKLQAAVWRVNYVGVSEKTRQSI